MVGKLLSYLTILAKWTLNYRNSLLVHNKQISFSKTWQTSTATSYYLLQQGPYLGRITPGKQMGPQNWITRIHFANCEENSSYCDWKVVNHTKNGKQFFPQGKFNSSGSYSSTSYPYFIHPMHAIISRNIAYTQNYIAKCKQCFPLF